MTEGATSRIVAAVMIGLAMTGCALARQPEQRREVAQRATDDSRCRSYGFKTDADLARCRMQLNVARLRGRLVILVELLQTRMHHPYRCCVAMQLRVETRDRCLSCARRSRSSSVEEIVDDFDCQSAGDEFEVNA